MMLTEVAAIHRTVSLDALCVITGMLPVHLKLEEQAQRRVGGEEMVNGGGVVTRSETVICHRKRTR